MVELQYNGTVTQLEPKKKKIACLTLLNGIQMKIHTNLQMYIYMRQYRVDMCIHMTKIKREQRQGAYGVCKSILLAPGTSG